MNNNILIAPVDQESWQFYQTLIPPYYQRKVEKKELNVLAIGATDGVKTLGLGVARLNLTAQNGELLSLYVEPSVRNQKIGTNLLIKLEDSMYTAGYANIFTKYTVQSHTANFEHILEKCKWQTPAIHSYLYKFDISSLVTNFPYANRFCLPKHYDCIQWNHLNRTQLEELRIWARLNKPEPDMMEHGLVPTLSFALCYESDVIGWITNRPLLDNTIRLLALYIKPECERFGLAYAFLLETFRHLTERGFRFVSAYTSISNRQIQNTITRFVRPYLVYEYEIRVSAKYLQ